MDNKIMIEIDKLQKKINEKKTASAKVKQRIEKYQKDQEKIENEINILEQELKVKQCTDLSNGLAAIGLNLQNIDTEQLIQLISNNKDTITTNEINNDKKTASDDILDSDLIL